MCVYLFRASMQNYKLTHELKTRAVIVAINQGMLWLHELRFWQLPDQLCQMIGRSWISPAGVVTPGGKHKKAVTISEHWNMHSMCRTLSKRVAERPWGPLSLDLQASEAVVRNEEESSVHTGTNTHKINIALSKMITGQIETPR